MKQDRVVLTLALLLAAMSSASPARAQRSNPTAAQPLQLSAFGAVAGVYTGLSEGKNFSLVAGVDLGLPPHLGMRPTLELRGLYPVDNGVVDSQRDILGGLKVDFLLNHRLHPYADFLFGRGQMNYGSAGYYYKNYIYDLTTTYVYSPGAGLDFRIADHLAIKVDGQFQRWSSAPTPSGNVYSKVGSLGLVYIFDFNRHGVIR
jgi:hypothetical protein